LTFLQQSVKKEAAVFGVVFKSHDKAEGTKAFVEKRKPEFKGN
jgi:enoyl-CoA hydratase/carnithine racemase